MSNTVTILIAKKDDVGTRLDRFVSEHIEGMTRSRAGRLIHEGLVLTNGKKAKAGAKVREGVEVETRIPASRPISAEPEPIPLNIIYEDESVVVVDKPAGMVVHPSAGHYTGTLVNALLYHFKKLSPVGGDLRPGIVHRLDKDTSGLLLVARDEESHLCLSGQLQDRSLSRLYYGIVHGSVKEDSGVIETRIARHPTNRKRMWANPAKGRMAVTEFMIVERFKGFTWLRFRLRTGRTHQIRAHISFKGHPIVGDTLYGGKKQRRLAGQNKPLIGRQALHAYRVGFNHPEDGRPLEFESPLSRDIEELLNKIRLVSV